MKGAYYNEFDAKAAAWLRELIRQGHIAPGDVDERSIADVRPDDLGGYAQCHFFAGIGGWSLALRLAGVADDACVWTGSCPCQPFSAAGRRGGTDDERHLWPAFFRLIAECRPPIVFGEQVASKDGLAWLDLVSADLEGAGYATVAADLCAAGIGAPHIRQRLYFAGVWVADSSSERLEGLDARSLGHERSSSQRGGEAGGLEHGSGIRRLEWGSEPSGRGVASGCTLGGMADLDMRGREQEPHQRPAGLLGADVRAREPGNQPRDLGAASSVAPFPGAFHPGWDDVDWLICRDERWRPVEPGTFPLAHGIPERVGLLRGYGNAIVPQVATTFIEAFAEALTDAEMA